MSGEHEMLTERLRLRRWQPADEAAMVVINQHPEVIRFLNRPVDGAAREHAVERLGLDQLISIIHPRNARSQRVALKLGMSASRLVHNPVLDIEVEVWRIARRR